MKKIIAVFIFIIFTMNLFCANSNPSVSKKGKIVILVLDVSGSIKPYFNTIKKVLIEKVVKMRLENNDYFVLIPFGDKAEILYSGQIFRDEDINTISRNFEKLVANNNFTDIGNSLKLGLNQVVELRSKEYDQYEPIVLYITDGNHTPPMGTEFFNKKIEDIFMDSFIGDKNLYLGWYFIGVGKNLTDIKKTAELSGREQFFLSIENVNDLEKILDEWINNIPPSKPMEKGDIVLNKIKFGSKLLNENSKNYLLYKEDNKLLLSFMSTYKTFITKGEINSVSLSYQSEDNAEYVNIQTNYEKGVFEIKPLQFKESVVSFDLKDKDELNKTGVVKINIRITKDYVEKEFIKNFTVKFISMPELIWIKWRFPIIFTILVVVIIVLFNLLKGFMPINIVMDISGTQSRNAKPVSFGVGKIADVGSKPGIQFKIEGAFGNIIARLKRASKDKWEINILDQQFFQDCSSNRLDYKLGSSIKLIDSNKQDFTVKFIKKNSSSSTKNSRSSSKSTSSSGRRIS